MSNNSDSDTQQEIETNQHPSSKSKNKISSKFKHDREYYNKMYIDNDFFVVGNYPKNENTNKILDGIFWFIIRKTTTKGWKIIALH